MEGRSQGKMRGLEPRASSLGRGNQRLERKEREGKIVLEG